jgi:hypothetical protein
MGVAILIVFVLALLILRGLIRSLKRRIPRLKPIGGISVTYTSYDRRRPAQRDDDVGIQVRQERPDGMGRKLAWNVKVAGISQPDTQRNAVRFITGTSQMLEIERDSSVTGFPHGLRVYGQWQEPDGKVLRGPLGWVPDEIARRIAEEPSNIPLVPRLRWMFPAAPGRNPGLRVDIWTKRRNKRVN